MKVLNGCEYSGIVRDEFIKLGHDAWSCDILDTESQGPHYKKDIMEVVEYGWDLIILHPPCTYMALCGNKHYEKGKQRHSNRLDAVEWTIKLWERAKANSSKTVLENPASVIFPILRTRDNPVQYIQPWQFGHMEQKKTGLLLNGVNPLVETKNVYDEMMELPKSERERIFYMSPGENRGKERSKFYHGIAKAMAEQWG